jgi:hypothetical protein
MNRFTTAAFAASALCALQISTPVQAQDQPPSGPNSPPSWEALVHCADMTDAKKELDCYRAAMRDAGYRRNPQVSAAERRKTFGLDLPPTKVARHEDKAHAPAQAQGSGKPSGLAAADNKAEDASRLTFTISEVAYTQPLNQLLIVTSDGAVWVQDDTIPLNFTPKRGATVEINKTVFGGYFCKFDRSNAMRCIRRN